jgi:alpha-L-fucosidase
MIETKYLPNKESLAKHKLPVWYQDAKLGIFVHWGLFSVPGWAVKEFDFQETLRKYGAGFWFRNNAYAEWYWNSLKIDSSATQIYHREVYGEDYEYTDFAKDFEAAVKSFDVNEWASLFKQAGARYAVLTSKHHDGYLLWNSRHPNPHRSDYQAKKDLVGMYADAMREEGIRVGIYYSGGIDWIFEPQPIENLVDLIRSIPSSSEYAAYVLDHYYELIERYHPDLLWNDIGFPANADLYRMLAGYYNQNPEGVVNDRFSQMRPGGVPHFRLTRNLINNAIEGMIKRGVDILGTNKSPKLGDFSTPEYTHPREIANHKWETCRGLGKSFGYNQLEEDADLMSSSALIEMLVDIVSKNGNLLINVGPKADGSIPEIQKKRLVDLGRWLAINGEAIFGSRPWVRAEGQGIEGVPLRFTRKDDKVYVFVMDNIRGDRLSLEYPKRVESIRRLGTTQHILFSQEGDILEILLDERGVADGEGICVYCLE